MNIKTNIKTIAYLRVSTTRQNIEKNKNEILHFANTRNLGQVTFFEETISGKISWKKRKIAELLNTLSEGDNFIVNELSRIGRNMLEIMEVLAIATERKINVYAIKGNWELKDTIQSKIMAMVFSMVAEIERDLISQRTKEALQARKAAGVKLGRPRGVGKSKLDKYRLKIQTLLNNGSTQKFIAQKYKTTEANLHHWMKKNKIKRKKI